MTFQIKNVKAVDIKQKVIIADLIRILSIIFAETITEVLKVLNC